MVKLIVFDLDGVLADSREVHYHSLNKALREVAPTFVISRAEHRHTYEGLPTHRKLELLTGKGLPKTLHREIWARKQKYTLEIIETLFRLDERMRDVLAALKRKRFTVYVASNCIYKTVQMILLKKGLMEYVDGFFSNEDVKRPKPSPEIYNLCMSRANVSARDTLIVEDSERGIEAAEASGGHVMRVESPLDVSYGSIVERMRSILNLNVVIPMAGNGSRFKCAGYWDPKPMVPVNDTRMIELVVQNLDLPPFARVIFVCKENHVRKYELAAFLERISPGCSIVTVNETTQGAACSILLARELIDCSTPLLLANSDQYMEWDSTEFLTKSAQHDGCIATFKGSDPKWSFARVDENQRVTEVAEKKPISDNATAGVYYWRRGSDFVKYADQMIRAEKRVNNEFYTAPVFNEAITDGRDVAIHEIRGMWGLGTPEDLKLFLKNFKN